MLQLRLDQLTGALATWGGTAITKTVQYWPGRFMVSVKVSVGTVVGQLGEGATGSLLLTNAASGAVLAKVPAFTRVGSGAAAYYNFFLNLDSAPIAAIFNATDPRIASLATKMELRFQDADGSDVAYFALPFEIQRAQGRGNEATPLPATVSAQSGFIRLGSGVDSGSIAFTPRMLSVPVVALALHCPPAAPLLTANLVGEATVDGFSFALSAPTTNGDYYLAWSAAITAGTATRQTGIAEVTMGSDTVEVAFDAAMTAPPIIRGFALECAEGDPLLFATVLGAPTVDGFTVQLSAVPTTSNYRLHYDAEVPA